MAKPLQPELHLAQHLTQCRRRLPDKPPHPEHSPPLAGLRLTQCLPLGRPPNTVKWSNESNTEVQGRYGSERGSFLAEGCKAKVSTTVLGLRYGELGSKANNKMAYVRCKNSFGAGGKERHVNGFTSFKEQPGLFFRFVVVGLWIFLKRSRGDGKGSWGQDA